MLNKLYLGVFAFALVSIFTSCEVLQGVLKSANTNTNQLTNAQIIQGLKEALNQGVVKGVASLARENGFFGDAALKILFPQQAQQVESRLRQLGLSNLVDQAILKINRAAEDASGQAKDIFVNAITQMTINDGMNILLGEKNACTQYLKRTTSPQLYAAFNPVIKGSLNKVGALDAWNSVITRYNQIPLVERVNPNLDDHVTNKTMDGVFTMVEKEERNIRANPVARTTDLMKRVFAKQDGR
jgi:hypothetical protein